MRPFSSTKDTLIEFALRNNEKLFQEHAKGMMKVMDIVTPKFIKDFRRLGRDGEVLALLEQAQKWNGKFKGSSLYFIFHIIIMGLVLYIHIFIIQQI